MNNAKNIKVVSRFYYWFNQYLLNRKAIWNHRKQTETTQKLAETIWNPGKRWNHLKTDVLNTLLRKIYYYLTAFKLALPHSKFFRQFGLKTEYSLNWLLISTGIIIYTAFIHFYILIIIWCLLFQNFYFL